jgi:DnaJ-class molecular chaperone
VASLPALEIQAIAKIMDELDYYQILHLERNVAVSDIKRAFHSTSRNFHPDTNRHLEPELRELTARIAKCVTEAYCVLRDPPRRRAYDDFLSKGMGLRMQLAEAKAASAKKQTDETQGKTVQGRQFYQKASEDIAGGQWSAAERNLKMAITFEPDNKVFKEKLEEVQKQS